MAGQPGGRTGLTYDDLVEMFAGEPDNVIRELIDGELFVSPSPGKRHQQAVLHVAVSLHEFAKQTGGRAYLAPLDVRFSDRDVLEPDVIYIGPGPGRPFRGQVPPNRRPCGRGLLTAHPPP